MKKSIPILLLALLTVCTIYGQDTTSLTTGPKPRTIDWSVYTVGKNPSLKFGDTINILGKLLKEQFGNIINGQSSTTIGNFASISPTEGKIDLAASLMFKNAGIFTFKASGKATDGIVSIFENSKLNSQISIEGKFHLLNRKRWEIAINTDSGAANDVAVRTLQYEFDKSNLSVKWRKDIEALIKIDADIPKKIDSLEKLKVDGLAVSKLKEIDFEIDKLKIVCDSVARVLADTPNQRTLYRRNQAKTIASLDKLSLSTAVQGLKLRWWSIGVKANNNSFTHFNSSAAFDKQLRDTSFTTVEASIQWSLYNWDPEGINTIFLSIGATAGITDNFSTLDKREFSETTNYGTVPGERAKTKKTTAYENIYERNLQTSKFYADVFWFAFKKNIAALHINPEWSMMKSEKPLFNTMAGLMLSIPKKDDDGTILNIELYYKFLDIFKTTETEYKLFERNNIGLRATFPINFKL